MQVLYARWYLYYEIRIISWLLNNLIFPNANQSDQNFDYNSFTYYLLESSFSLEKYLYLNDIKYVEKKKYIKEKQLLNVDIVDFCNVLPRKLQSPGN